jgi:hypothetical protein
MVIAVLLHFDLCITCSQMSTENPDLKRSPTSMN